MYLPSLYLSTHSNLNSFVYFVIKTSKVVGTTLEVHYITHVFFVAIKKERNDSSPMIFTSVF